MNAHRDASLLALIADLYAQISVLTAQLGEARTSTTTAPDDTPA